MWENILTKHISFSNPIGGRIWIVKQHLTKNQISLIVIHSFYQLRKPSIITGPFIIINEKQKFTICILHGAVSDVRKIPDSIDEITNRYSILCLLHFLAECSSRLFYIIINHDYFERVAIRHFLHNNAIESPLQGGSFIGTHTDRN